MQQPPIADFLEDIETRQRRGRLGVKHYLAAVPVVAVLVAVVALGASGPRPPMMRGNAAPTDATASPAASGSGEVSGTGQSPTGRPSGDTYVHGLDLRLAGITAE